VVKVGKAIGALPLDAGRADRASCAIGEVDFRQLAGMERSGAALHAVAGQRNCRNVKFYANADDAAERNDCAGRRR